MTKKFNVNGRETEWYYLTYQDKIDLIRDENTSDEDKKFLTDKLIESVEYDLCPKTNEGETRDDVFARFFSNYVNCCGCNKKKAAEHMAREHRHLQNEMFKVCLEYIKILAENCDNGRYDLRNEWAAKTSKEMIDHLKAIDYWY